MTILKPINLGEIIWEFFHIVRNRSPAASSQDTKEKKFLYDNYNSQIKSKQYFNRFNTTYNDLKANTIAAIFTLFGNAFIKLMHIENGAKDLSLQSI